MLITDVVEKGALTLKKHESGYVVEYSGYNEYGNLKTMTFEAKSLRIAYMKLEEYLSTKIRY